MQRGSVLREGKQNKEGRRGIGLAATAVPPPAVAARVRKIGWERKGGRARDTERSSGTERVPASRQRWRGADRSTSPRSGGRAHVSTGNRVRKQRRMYLVRQHNRAFAPRHLRLEAPHTSSGRGNGPASARSNRNGRNRIRDASTRHRTANA